MESQSKWYSSVIRCVKCNAPYVILHEKKGLFGKNQYEYVRHDSKVPCSEGVRVIECEHLELFLEVAFLNLLSRPRDLESCIPWLIGERGEISDTLLDTQATLKKKRQKLEKLKAEIEKLESEEEDLLSKKGVLESENPIEAAQSWAIERFDQTPEMARKLVRSVVEVAEVSDKPWWPTLNQAGNTAFRVHFFGGGKYQKNFHESQNEKKIPVLRAQIERFKTALGLK